MASIFCSRCGTQLSPGSQFCDRCGTPLNAASSTSASPPPPPPPVWSVAPSPAPPPPSGAPPPPSPAVSPVQSAPESVVKGRRVAASSLVLIAAILLTVAMMVSWWELSLSGGGATATVNFLPGSSYSGSGAYNGITYSASATYASSKLTNVGYLYEAILGLGLTAAIAAFAGMALGYASAFGTSRPRHSVGIAADLTELSTALALALPVLTVFMQPWVYNLDTSNAGAPCGGGSTPCNSFWGSVSSGGVTATWGADVGWYLVVAAAALLVVAAVLFWASEPKLYTRDELLGASPQAAAPAQAYPAEPLSPPYSQYVAPSTVYTQPTSSLAPPPPPPAQAVPAQVAERYCPSCGAGNARASAFCESCGKPLPPRP